MRSIRPALLTVTAAVTTLILLPACGRPPEATTVAAASAPAVVVAQTATPSAPAPAAAPAGATAIQVVDGYKVDATTMTGFRTWRAAACDRCHGANQEGMVGPSLINSLKTLSKDDFVATVTKGRLEKGMPSFATSTDVTSHIDALYQYLKGRSDGTITRAKVEPLS